jgi:hypothetical protein
MKKLMSIAVSKGGLKVGRSLGLDCKTVALPRRRGVKGEMRSASYAEKLATQPPVCRTSTARPWWSRTSLCTPLHSSPMIPGGLHAG